MTSQGKTKAKNELLNEHTLKYLLQRTTMLLLYYFTINLLL